MDRTNSSSSPVYASRREFLYLYMTVGSSADRIRRKPWILHVRFEEIQDVWHWWSPKKRLKTLWDFRVLPHIRTTFDSNWKHSRVGKSSRSKALYISKPFTKVRSFASMETLHEREDLHDQEISLTVNPTTSPKHEQSLGLLRLLWWLSLTPVYFRTQGRIDNVTQRFISGINHSSSSLNRSRLHRPRIIVLSSTYDVNARDCAHSQTFRLHPTIKFISPKQFRSLLACHLQRP